MKKYREVDWFAKQMKKVLGANEGKPGIGGQPKTGWQECSSEDLIKRLRQETTELNKAIISGADVKAVIKEAADVANFAMMIADNANTFDDIF